MKLPLRTVVLLSLLANLWCSVAPARAQTSAFTYQGSLAANGSYANGTYAFQFALFTDASGGSQVGATQTIENVTVTNGTFSTPLDFGGAAFTGADRWLQVSVKGPADASYSPLTPRHQLASAPYAIRTLSAATADGLSTACSACITSSEIASVTGTQVTGAVATATNATQLGGVAASSYVQTNDARLSDARAPTAGSSNYIQNSTSQQSATNFNISGNGTLGGTLAASTRVGIGTTSPGFRLHILDTAFPSIRVDGSNTSGAWMQLNNTGSGGHNWGILSSGTANGEGAGNLVLIDETGGGSVYIDNPVIVNNANLTANTVIANTQYNLGANRVLAANAQNTFLGLQAGNANPSGIQNSFFGSLAGQKDGSGAANSFFGYNTGANTVTGSNNAFFGANAGQNNTASGNTFVGSSAGNGNTSGQNNVMVGKNAGVSNIGENSNTFLGYNAQGGGGTSNATALGANAHVTTSNAVVLGSVFDDVGNPTDTFVGIGTTAPNTKLNVVENNSGLFRIARLEGSSTTGSWLELNNTSTGGHTWALISAASTNGEGAGNLVLTDETGGGKVVMNNTLQVPNCTGCTTAPSDRNLKTNFAPVDRRSVLTRVAEMPIETWNYKSDSPARRHIGPMAQDFSAAFGLSDDDTHIDMIDEGGVSLAAIQELYGIDREKDEQIKNLTRRVEELEKLVNKLTEGKK